jgi:hypothetical protein
MKRVITVSAIMLLLAAGLVMAKGQSENESFPGRGTGGQLRSQLSAEDYPAEGEWYRGWGRDNLNKDGDHESLTYGPYHDQLDKDGDGLNDETGEALAYGPKYYRLNGSDEPVPANRGRGIMGGGMGLNHSSDEARGPNVPGRMDQDFRGKGWGS